MVLPDEQRLRAKRSWELEVRSQAEFPMGFPLPALALDCWDYPLNANLRHWEANVCGKHYCLGRYTSTSEAERIIQFPAMQGILSAKWLRFSCKHEERRTTKNYEY